MEENVEQVVQVDSSFEPLPLARTPVMDALEGQYRVYTDPGRFIMVQATSAVEALEASGLKKALRIERESLHKNNLLIPKFIQEAIAAEAAANAARVDPEAPVSTVASDGMPGTPLSNDAVDKLLGE